MNATVNDFLLIIGRLNVENELLRRQVGQLLAKLEEKRQKALAEKQPEHLPESPL